MHITDHVTANHIIRRKGCLDLPAPEASIVFIAERFPWIERPSGFSAAAMRRGSYRNPATIRCAAWGVLQSER